MCVPWKSPTVLLKTLQVDVNFSWGTSRRLVELNVSPHSSLVKHSLHIDRAITATLVATIEG